MSFSHKQELMGPPSFPDYSVGELAAILCHFNPCGYTAPVINLWRTINWLQEEGLPTYAFELYFNSNNELGRALPVTHSHIISYETSDVIFYKENLWNILARTIPAKYKYILCLDADVILSGKNIAERIVRQLQMAPVVQPFSRAYWADSLGVPFKSKFSMGYAYENRLENPHIAKLYHPGFALALRRDFWSMGPGFYEREPLGGGNTMFVAAVTGNSDDVAASLKSVSPALEEDYICYRDDLRDGGFNQVSYIDGDALHLWHGSTKKRLYLERTAILKGFDPLNDLTPVGPFGVLNWTTRARANKRRLIEGIKEYFGKRDEDEWFDSTVVS